MTAKTLGQVGGHQVEFTPVHREDNPSRVVTTVALGVPLSLEDITAVLMYLTEGCGHDELIDWLSDPGEVRRLVLESAWGLGGFGIEQQRRRLAGIESGTWESERLDLVWTCSVRVFTPATVPAPRVSLEVAR
ncbi:hypothetical protein [Amycolatopsis plumensis]|uniref:Uncharacterized protein n=1 Tax=Amycolatopsis plumensis TaxID=236508 RepID=A0ABV5UIG5_9PSEU